MGKSPKPLRIVVTEPELMDHPDIQELVNKGHSAEPMTQECDVVLGEKAWWFHPNWSKMADVIQAAWTRVYPKGKS